MRMIIYISIFLGFILIIGLPLVAIIDSPIYISLPIFFANLGLFTLVIRYLSSPAMSFFKGLYIWSYIIAKKIPLGIVIGPNLIGGGIPVISGILIIPFVLSLVFVLFYCSIFIALIGLVKGRSFTQRTWKKWIESVAKENELDLSTIETKR